MRVGVQEVWLLTSWPHPSHPIQSYCLKVKEMDDEEYSCIVSTEGAPAGSGKAWGAHTSSLEGPGSARGSGWCQAPWGLNCWSLGLSAHSTSSSGLEYQLVCHEVTPLGQVPQGCEAPLRKS